MKFFQGLFKLLEVDINVVVAIFIPKAARKAEQARIYSPIAPSEYSLAQKYANFYVL